MSYTLKRECAILLIHNGIGYRFDALSDFNYSQTFSKVSNTRKTLHSRKAKQNTMVTGMNTPTFDMSVLCTDTLIEGIFFQLLGWDSPSKNVFTYPEVTKITPEMCELYIISSDDTFKVSHAVIRSLDVGLSLMEFPTFDVSFEGSSIERTDSIPLVSGNLSQGEILKPSPIQFRYNSTLNNSVINVGLSFQQEIAWRQDRSLHDIGQVYRKTVPTINDITLTVNINTYLKGEAKQSHTPETADIEINKNRIYLKLDSALVTKRTTSEDVFLENYDISMTEATNAYVEYGGRQI